MKSILICTQHRGVFFGQIEDGRDLTNKMLTDIKNCRMAINWRNGKGVQGLAADGPDDTCKIASACDVEVMHDITAIFTVTEKATQAWLSA